jgi:hypothetical protein
MIASGVLLAISGCGVAVIIIFFHFRSGVAYGVNKKSKAGAGNCGVHKN